MSGLGLLVTASERAVSTENASTSDLLISTRVTQNVKAARGPEDGIDTTVTTGSEKERVSRTESSVNSTPSGSPSRRAHAGTGAAKYVGKGGVSQHEEESEGDAAARHGDLETCRRKYDRGEIMNFTSKALDNAAAASHLDMVKWLTEKGFSCTTDAMDRAAQEGKLEVVKWLHENRQEGCSLSALPLAAGRGHLPIVRYFYENSMPGDIVKAIADAEKAGHGEVVEWLHKHSSNKRAKTDGRAPSAEGFPPGQAGFSRQGKGSPNPNTRTTLMPSVVGMFGSPFGNFVPVNGITMGSPTSQSMGGDDPGAKGMTPMTSASGIPSASPRLRRNMLRSPELALATSGGLRYSVFRM